MSKPHEQWKVLPHGKLVEIDPNIMTVTGTLRMPLVTLPRRMTVARLADKRLVIFSAISLDVDGMQALESYGRPAFLVVPNAKHRMDAKSWKLRYPSIQVVAPAGARRQVADVVPVDTSEPEFGDPTVKFITVPGTGRREGALLIDTLVGTTLVLNDLVGNIRNAAGVGGWLLRKMNFAGDDAAGPEAGALDPGRGQGCAARAVPAVGGAAGAQAHPRLARRSDRLQAGRSAARPRAFTAA